MKSLSLSLLLPALFLSGCYTQLATRGHYDRGQAAPPPAYEGPEAAPADSLAAAPAPADTLTPPTGAPTVIVHNYYDPHPYHRGYAHWEWEYPLLSFGYYSSHYGRYARPYWWDDPWYSRRHIHRHHHRPHVHVPARPAAPPGPYRSEKRLFNPDPAYPQVRKGRRSEEPASPPAEVAPAPKEGSSQGGGPGSGDSGSSEAEPQRQDDKPEKEYRSLQKGRRR